MAIRCFVLGFRGKDSGFGLLWERIRVFVERISSGLSCGGGWDGGVKGWGRGRVGGMGVVVEEGGRVRWRWRGGGGVAGDLLI